MTWLLVVVLTGTEFLSQIWRMRDVCLVRRVANFFGMFVLVFQLLIAGRRQVGANTVVDKFQRCCFIRHPSFQLRLGFSRA